MVSQIGGSTCKWHWDFIRFSDKSGKVRCCPGGESASFGNVVPISDTPGRPEILASIGGHISGWNSVSILNYNGINARFVDLGRI
jgi:hypothetical protein